MSAIDWDAVKVGDPDPTVPPISPMLSDDDMCDGETDDDWYCTRAAGHTGPHVAGTTESVVAVWPSSGDPA